MALFQMELYKLFSQKIIYIVFFVLVLFSTGFTYYHGAAEEREVYQSFEGTITEEKLALAQKEVEVLNEKLYAEEGIQLTDDEWTLMGVYESITYGSQIEQNKVELIQELDAKNSIAAKHEKSMHEQIDTSYFAYNKGPIETIDYASFFSIMITGAMLLIGLATTFTQEHYTGVDNYILSAKKGRKPIVYAKLAAAFVYTVAVVLGWEIFNLIWNGIQFSHNGWDTAIQYSFKYYFSPFSFTMLEFHLIELGFHLLGACAFAFTIVLVSALCKNSFVSLIISGSIFAVPYFLMEAVDLPKVLEHMLQFSFLYVMNVEKFFSSYQAIELFGVIVLYAILAVIVMIGVLCVVPFWINRIVKRKEVAS